MQAEELQHYEKQEEYAGSVGDEQVLPILPQAHRS
jgi:hypothetical protein